MLSATPVASCQREASLLKINKVVAPMETVLSILAFPIVLAIYGIPFGVLAMLIASGSDKWASEDQAQYRVF